MNHLRQPGQYLYTVPDETALAERRKRWQARRRILAVLLGAGIGLILGAGTQFLNPIVLPGLPLFSPPFGAQANALVIVLVSLGIALATGWASASSVGVLWGVLASVIVLLASLLLQLDVTSTRGLFTAGAMVLVSLPLAGLLAVGIIAFRLILDAYLNAWKNETVWVRALLAVALMGVTGWIAVSGVYSLNQRFALVRLNAALREAVAAPSPEALPDWLRSERAGNFLAYATPRYRLTPEDDPNNRYAIPRPANTQGQEALVVARFDGGWRLVCLFPWPTAEPECRGLPPAQAVP